MPTFPKTSYLAMTELIKYYSFDRSVGDVTLSTMSDVFPPASKVLSGLEDDQDLLEIFLDVSKGAMFTCDLLQFLADRASSDRSDKASALVQVYYEPNIISNINMGAIQPGVKEYQTAAIGSFDDEFAEYSAFTLAGRNLKTLRASHPSQLLMVDILPDPLSISNTLKLTTWRAKSDIDTYILVEHLMACANYPGSNTLLGGAKLRFSFMVIAEDGTEKIFDLDIEESDINPSKGASGSALIAHIENTIQIASPGISSQDLVSETRNLIESIEAEVLRITNTRSSSIPVVAPTEFLNSFKINGNPKNPSSYSTPGLSVIIMPNLSFNPTMRHVGQAALFCSGPPTTEMSLCAPFINLSFIINTPAVDTNLTTSANMISFLSDGSLSLGTVDYAMANSLPADIGKTGGFIDLGFIGAGDKGSVSSEGAAVTRSGMDLFMSPQTLVNMDINQERSNPVIDPTQPLMSLDGITVKEYQSGWGLIGFKRATINITLHDRSRLGEVAHFIAPASFGQVSSFLEFGWSHPNGDIATGSPWGIFLNSLRNSGKYRLIKGNYSMTSTGQVKITLEMGSSGGEDSKTTHVCTGQYVHTSLVKGVLREIKAQLVKQARDPLGVSVDVMAKLHVSTKGSGGNQLIDRSIYDNLRNAREKLFSGMMAGEEMEEILSHTWSALEMPADPGDETYVRKVSVKSMLGDVFDNLNPCTTSSDDPFISNLSFPKSTPGLNFADITLSEYDTQLGGREALDLTNPPEPVTPEDNDEEAEGEEEGSEGAAEDVTPGNDLIPDVEGVGDWVSLGKAMAVLVAKPLAATGRYDEVQLIFYGFNECAGALAGREISCFPIRYSTLKGRISAAAKKNTNVTTATINSILGDLVNNGAAKPYGFDDLYTKARNLQEIADAERKKKEAAAAAAEEAGEPLPKEDSVEDETPKFNLREAVIEKMYDLGLPMPKFKIPTLKILLEAVPAVTFPTGYSNPPVRDRSKTILRIHVLDSNASSHPGEQLVLDSISTGDVPSLFSNWNVQKGDISGIGRAIDSVYSAVDPETLDSLITEGSKTAPGSENQYDSLKFFAAKSSRKNIHRFIKSKVPTVQFGTAFSPFKDISISGMSSGALFDALLSAAYREKSDPQTKLGNKTGIEEVTVVPVTAKASGLGNPMFHYGQQFYLDLNTGTTADNIFTVRDVTHTLGPGKFETDVSFYPSGQNSSVSSIRGNMISALATLDKASGPRTKSPANLPEPSSSDIPLTDPKTGIITGLLGRIRGRRPFLKLRQEQAEAAKRVAEASDEADEFYWNLDPE